MGNISDIKSALLKIVEKNSEEFCCVCTVDSVTNNTAYCIPIEQGKADLPEVRLICDTSKKGFIIKPKKGSFVIVSFLNNEAGYISMFSEVDEILLNGDFYGGIPQVQPLVDKINALENLVNDILNVLKTTSIPLAPSGTYPFAPLYAAFNDIIPITQKSDLENTTVKHGNGN